MRTAERREIHRMLLLHDPHCWFCGRRPIEATATIDHFISRSRGGQDRAVQQPAVLRSLQ